MNEALKLLLFQIINSLTLWPLNCNLITMINFKTTRYRFVGIVTGTAPRTRLEDAQCDTSNAELKDFLRPRPSKSESRINKVATDRRTRAVVEWSIRWLWWMSVVRVVLCTRIGGFGGVFFIIGRLKAAKATCFCCGSLGRDALLNGNGELRCTDRLRFPCWWFCFPM